MMNSLAKSSHRENGPTTKLTCSFCNSVTTTLQACMNPAVTNRCEEPKTLFPYDECGWDYIDDTSGKLLGNTLVEKARAEEISVIRELGVWEADRPYDEFVFGTR